MKKILTMAAMLSMCVLGTKAQVILQDSFNYSDEGSTNVSAGLWTNYSGTADSQVVNGRLEVFGTRAGDVYRPFTNTLSSSVAYASFIVNATNLVTGSSNYFAHFSINSTTFRARVFSVGNAPGAPNSWHLGITAGASANNPQIFPLDLATNVDYRVVISYDTVSFLATLWVDPASETDTKKQSVDTVTAGTLGYFSFRQSSPNQNFQVDDLYVGNSFADVNVGAVKPAVVYYQPPAGPTTNFVNGNMTLSCVGGGAGTVSFQWTHAGTNLMDDANYTGTSGNILSLVNAVTTQSGAYRCIITSTTNGIFASSATSSVANVVITAAPVPPSFITQPASQTLYRGQNMILTTTVASPGTATFTWYSNNVVVTAGQVDAGYTSTLELDNVATNNSATYKVAVTNNVAPNGIVSSNAVVTVVNPPAVSIAYLRSLVDPNNFYQPTNTTLPYQITGTVTTYTNLTTANTSSYYLQDATAGINIFATFGSTFRPAQGDVVTFVGVLSSFSSGLELVANTDPSSTIPYTSYSIISNNFPLPTPLSIPFTVTNNNYSNMNYTIAGKLVQLTGVYFGVNAGTAITNGFMTVTNGLGQSFNLWFSAVDFDVLGQTLPAYATTVTGVMFGSMNPVSGVANPTFAVAVTKFSDIVAGVPTSTDLSVSKTGPAYVFATSNLTYSITVSNAGPDAASGVTATDSLPAGTTFVSATGGGANSSGVVTWSLDAIASGATSNVTVTVKAPASGSLTNKAGVSSSSTDPNLANNTSANVITSVAPVPVAGPIAVSGGNATVRWNAVAGPTYSVLWSTNVAGPYSVIASGLTSSPYTDTAHTSQTRGFYKITSP